MMRAEWWSPWRVVGEALIVLACFAVLHGAVNSLGQALTWTAPRW
ncbi:hypothetical protein ABZY19_33980 [Streptomyces sp. NPDC006475]